MVKASAPNFKKITFTLCVSAVIILLIMRPQYYINSVYRGLVLFAVNVLPALFPFFFFTKLLTAVGTVQTLTDKLKKPLRNIFNLPPSVSYIFFMSMLSGYPVGAKLVSEFYEQGEIGRDEVTGIAAICSTSGPLFVIGTVGFSVLGNQRAGTIIYAAHILSVLLFALLRGIFLKLKGRRSPAPAALPEKKQPAAAPLKSNGQLLSKDKILSESIYNSVISILMVGGFISIFYMLIDMLQDFFLLGMLQRCVEFVLELFNEPYQLGEGIASGFFEVTRGCTDLAKGLVPLRFKLPACAFIITLSGACIAAQSFAFLGKCKINYIKFIGCKLLQAVIAVFLCLLIMKAFPV